MIFNFFDSFAIVISAALKGAGDSVFPMKAIAYAAVIVLIIPVYIEIAFLELGLYWAFITLCVYVITYVSALFLRFKLGKWKEMKVIEKTAIEKAAAEL